MYLGEWCLIYINQSEWDVLKIYLAKTQQGTVHNLLIAHQYFQETKQEDMFRKLLEKVEKMSATEFSTYIEQLSFP